MPSPGLDLVFTPDGSFPFLRKGFFKRSAEGPANGTLAEDPKGAKFLCAFCIFILLTKYKGADPKNPEKLIIHKDEEKKLSWLNTLGVDKDELDGFIQDCFDGYRFFATSRGTAGKVPAFAHFNPEQLKLENVRLYKAGPDSSRIPLEHLELRKFAEKLEEYGVRQKHLAWEPTVAQQADEIESSGRAKISKRFKRVKEKSDGNMTGCRISPTWLTLFDEALAEIEERELGGNWYVVCGTPMWMVRWGDHFSKAVSRGATVRFAHHASTAPDKCPSVAAQWEMNIEHLQEANPIRFLKNRMREGISQIASWDEAARKQKAKGKFEFYQSHISHPFVCILVVPKPVESESLENHPSPKGTQCLLALNTFFPRSHENRVGLHFYQPSPSLDIYYNSIRRYFLPETGRRHLEGVDHLAALRSGKVAKRVKN